MKEDIKKGKSFAINAVEGSFAGLGVCLLLLAVFSVLIAGGKLSSGLMEYISIGVFFVGSFAGAAVTIKREKGKLLLAGLAEGALLFLVTIVVGAFMPGALIGNATLPLLISGLFGGAAAGLFFSRPKKVKF